MTERELLTIVLGIGILAYFCVQYRRQPSMEGLLLPLLGFSLILLGWIANGFDGDFSNWIQLAEHACYATGAIVFTFWTRKLQRGESKWIR